MLPGLVGAPSKFHERSRSLDGGFEIPESGQALRVRVTCAREMTAPLSVVVVAAANIAAAIPGARSREIPRERRATFAPHSAEIQECSASRASSARRGRTRAVSGEEWDFASCIPPGRSSFVLALSLSLPLSLSLSLSLLVFRSRIFSGDDIIGSSLIACCITTEKRERKTNKVAR